ncbi:MAG: hypothetical protein QF652_00275 [Dehalococcoidia bacterium]|nr:hypothetical protein [Dehalococcoidia bacterium]
MPSTANATDGKHGPVSSFGGGLAGPPVNSAFERTLSDLIAVTKRGHDPASEYFNPSDEWLRARMRILQDLPAGAQAELLEEAAVVEREATGADAEGKAASRAWADAAIRLDSGGLGFFSQLGVARRPDLTQYFIDGYDQNRDSLAFSPENQELFAEILPHITAAFRSTLADGTTVTQTDRRIGDVPERSFHARQMLFGTRYLHLPYMWKQLTFELPSRQRVAEPDILEVSLPNWLEDITFPTDLKARIEKVGLTKLVFKAPKRGLSLHLGFDYLGEHKMGPLSIAMFKAKEADGLAVQAALSVAHVDTVDGKRRNTALVTLGPSLHGKSTLTIMLELADSDLAKLLKRKTDLTEGVYPMNDDIILLQKTARPSRFSRNGKTIEITRTIDGTEDNFYAVPFRLDHTDDPITYDVLRGSADEPNPSEILENVPVSAESGTPNFFRNPVRNMRMILSRSRLVERRNASAVLEAITGGELDDSVHVPMEHMDRLIWQGVMRQNTVVPPLVRLTAEQYIRSLMFGEAVQTGAAAGAIGRPYVEYFSDPFIIGLEDDNANIMYRILREITEGGMDQEFYIFNTGGVGADSNDAMTGDGYRKITREVTLMLQEALLRNAVKFEHDSALGTDVAVAIVDASGGEVMDLRQDWLPKGIYGDAEYERRMKELKRKRYYGDDQEDRAGILRYTKVSTAIFDQKDIPVPSDERELAWLTSFYWHLEGAHETLAEASVNSTSGTAPSGADSEALSHAYRESAIQGLVLSAEAKAAAQRLGLT